ncbi:MAG: hypothetical protein IMZ66_06915 [Planctomycetes bacterium]|nr:hypothetical protein [Planctomycetota bacterium]
MADPMPRYQHTQPATVIRVCLLATVLAAVVLAAVIPVPEEDLTTHRLVCLAVAASMAILTDLFWSLTVTVTGHRLAWHFGPGFIRKSVPLDEIASAAPTRTTFWAGWGIHWMPRGWVYNVSGFRAVEVRLKSGKAFVLGTDEPDALAAAVRAAAGLAPESPAEPVA